MFIYSLPLFFAYSDLGSPFELLLIVLTGLVMLYISAPFIEEELPDKPFRYPLYQYLFYCWTAQLHLWRVFWPFFGLINCGIFAADYAVRAGAISISSWDDVHFMFFVSGIFWAISIWRSSANTQSRFWAANARLVTLLIFLEFGLKIYLRNNYPTVLFNCEERAFDYLICL